MRVGGEAPDKPISSAVQDRLKQFRAMNKMKKLALKVTSIHISVTSNPYILALHLTELANCLDN